MGRKSKEQLKKEANAKNVTRWQKANTKNYMVRFNFRNEQEIIDYLDSKENKKQYLKALILADMEKNR